MSQPTEPILREALEHLAAPAEVQETYLRQIGTWPSLDELALELDDVAEASEVWTTRELRKRLSLLSDKLAEMSGQENARLWEPDALNGHEWAEVRRLAAEAPAAFA